MDKGTRTNMTNESSDVSSSIPNLTCDDYDQLFSFKINVFMLPIAVVYIAALSMIVKRKQVNLSCCWGRPGVLYPINLLDDYHLRGFSALCFIVCTRTIFGLFSGDMIYDPIPYKDGDWMLKLGWLSVFVKLLNVIMVCLLYYPIFACASHHQHLVANIAGIVYAIPLISRECLIIDGCSKTGMIPMEIGTNVIYWVPVLLALITYIAFSIFELVKNVRKFVNREHVNHVEYAATIIRDESHFQTYVRALLLRHKQIKPRQPEPTTLQEKILKIFYGVVERFTYERVPGFRYPVRLLCTLMVSATTLAWVVINLAMYADLIFNSFKFYTDQLSSVTSIPISEYLDIARIIAAVSNVTAGFIQFIYLFHMLILYKRRMLKLYRGDRSWYGKFDMDPSSQLVGGMRYSGYQIAFIFYGWVFTGFLLFVVLTLVSLLVIVPIRDRVRNWIIDQIIKLWPTVVVSVIISYSQVLMCKYFFIQGKNEVLALTNRGLYHVMAFILFIFNVIIGVFAGIKRILLSALLGTIRLGRLDHVLIMRGFEQLDSGHMAYIAMMNVDVTHNHPVLRTFIELLKELRYERKHLSIPGVSEAERLRKYRVKMKWWKSVSMINNPTLVFDRIQRLYRAKQKTHSGATVEEDSTLENDSIIVQTSKSTEFLMKIVNGGKETEMAPVNTRPPSTLV